MSQMLENLRLIQRIDYERNNHFEKEDKQLIVA
jgi:hypothetical protein